MTGNDHLTMRRARPEDMTRVIEVCSSALQWSGDQTDAAFFSWKHLENPFGTSPIWVAEDDVKGESSIVAVRAMMRWALQRSGSPTMEMVRAVDTATLPSHQGRGLFSRLTRAAIDELQQDGVDAIFNTPNEKSKGGYLKLGWQVLGRVPVTARPKNPITLLAMVRSQVAAEKWGIPTEAGLDPATAFADTDRLDAILEGLPVGDRWSTPLSASYLRWRTAFEPLACRVFLLGSSLEDGFIVFRLRKRGQLRQLSLLHMVRPDSAPELRPAITALMGATSADLAMASGGDGSIRDGLFPLPSAGPVLTWRTLATDSTPDMSELALPLGAIEMF